MKECPDHSRDEPPWMCQCAKEENAQLRARLERAEKVLKKIDNPSFTDSDISAMRNGGMEWARVYEELAHKYFLESQ